jgi:hypothetical protein
MEHSISGHSVDNELDMNTFIKDFDERIEEPWNQFAEHVLPRKHYDVVPYR